MKKISLFLLFGLFFLTIGFFEIHASANEASLQEQCAQIVNFISDHFSEFKKEYNKAYEEKLSATRIEGYSPIYIIDAEEYGVYLDFNDDRGYLVTTLSYNIYKVEVTGDLNYLKGETFFYYSVQDGFLYQENGVYQKYDEGASNSNFKYGYSGQSGSGESNIYDISGYVADRYPDYTFEESNEHIVETGRMISCLMSEFSYYIKHISKDGGYTYPYMEVEANCAITAATNVMFNWRTMFLYAGIPAYDWRHDITERMKEDPDYNAYANGSGGVGITSYWTKNDASILENFPDLYNHLRIHARSSTSFRPDHGMTIDETRDVMLAAYLDYNKDPITINKTTTFADALNSLSKDKAVLMGVNNSISYSSSHAVALLGYYKYTYKSGWWIFSSTKTAYFYAINDGYNPYAYFDPNCNSKLSFEFLYL